MNIRRIQFISGLACVLAAGTAQYAQADSSEGWNGCYAGLNAGYGRAHISGVDTDVSNAIGSAVADGGAIGGQLGCDHTIGNWLLGVQLSADKTHLTGSHQYINGTGPSDRVAYDVRSLLSLTGRVGYQLQSETVAYLKAGGARARTNHNDADLTPLAGIPYSGSANASRNGWLSGVGLERKFGSNWSTYVGYDYMDFGKRAVTIAYTDGTVSNYSFKPHMSYLGLGVNYRF